MISVRGGVTKIFLVSAAASSLALGFAFASGCSSDDAGTLPGVTPTPEEKDAATHTTDPSQPGTDAAPGEDAADAADAAPLQGCAAHAGAAFCDDFDNPDALKPGTTKWDFIEPTDQPVVTLSSDQAVSRPSSLLSRVIDGTTPGAKFAKTITKADLKEATWEYDVYLDSVGTGAGFFLDDFQFSDTDCSDTKNPCVARADTFGFRLVILANAGAIGTFRVEHNTGALAVPEMYAVEADLPGTATLGAWHHFKQDVKFEFASGDAGAGDGGTAESATYTLTVDGAATPAFTKKYTGISRAKVAFARFAGMPFIFDKAQSAGLKIYWDNHVTELK